MSFRVIGGDFSQSASLMSMFGQLSLQPSAFSTESVPLTGNLERVEQVTEQNQKKFLGAAGWGLVGMAALGPVGALAGVLAGGNKKEICFACYLKDGRKFMAIADAATYQQFVAATMTRTYVAPVRSQDSIQAEQEYANWPKWGKALFWIFLLSVMGGFLWMFNNMLSG